MPRCIDHCYADGCTFNNALPNGDSDTVNEVNASPSSAPVHRSTTDAVAVVMFGMSATAVTMSTPEPEWGSWLTMATAVEPSDRGRYHHVYPGERLWKALPCTPRASWLTAMTWEQRECTQ